MLITPQAYDISLRDLKLNKFHIVSVVFVEVNFSKWSEI